MSFVFFMFCFYWFWSNVVFLSDYLFLIFIVKLVCWSFRFFDFCKWVVCFKGFCLLYFCFCILILRCFVSVVLRVFGFIWFLRISVVFLGILFFIEFRNCVFGCFIIICKVVNVYI